MPLNPFRVTLPDLPDRLEPIEASLQQWAAGRYGDQAVIVRWAVVGHAGGWVVEGVAGTLDREMPSPES